MAPARRQRSKSKGPEADTSQADDLVADSREKSSDLPVFALCQFHFQKTAASLSLDSASTANSKAAVREVEPLFELLNCLRFRDSGDLKSIGADHAEPRMHQLVREFTVIRDQQEPFAALVESANGEQSRAVVKRDELNSQRPSAGIAIRTDITDWLIDEEIPLSLGSQDFSIEADFLILRIDPRPKLRDVDAVDRDSAGLDKLLAGASRSQPGRGQEPLQSHSGVGWLFRSLAAHERFSTEIEEGRIREPVAVRRPLMTRRPNSGRRRVVQCVRKRRLQAAEGRFA